MLEFMRDVSNRTHTILHRDQATPSNSHASSSICFMNSSHLGRSSFSPFFFFAGPRFPLLAEVLILSDNGFDLTLG